MLGGTAHLLNFVGSGERGWGWPEHATGLQLSARDGPRPLSGLKLQQPAPAAPGAVVRAAMWHACRHPADCCPYPACHADTLSAAYYAQFALNGGKPVAQSIPATEHSVMTSWPSGAPAVCICTLRCGCCGRLLAAAGLHGRGCRKLLHERGCEKLPRHPPPSDAEREALSNMIARFGDGVFATVMDSYDYHRVSAVTPICSMRDPPLLH